MNKKQPTKSNSWKYYRWSDGPEFLCQHGGGHSLGVHGCDGCCHCKEFIEMNIFYLRSHKEYILTSIKKYPKAYSKEFISLVKKFIKEHYAKKRIAKTSTRYRK